MTKLLNTKKHARDAARLKLDTAVGALERARGTAAECQREADRLAAEEASWISRHARKLESWIAAGSHGTRPVAAADAQAIQKQLSAKANAAAAQSAVAQFESAERSARAELQAAERAVHEAALAVLGVEAEELAGEIGRLRSDLEARELRLRALRDLPDFTPSPRMLVAMADDLNTPTHLLRSRGDLDTPANVLAGHVHRGAEAAREWRERLEQLKAGDDDDGTSESVAA